jgi:hypothetical protein
MSVLRRLLCCFIFFILIISCSAQSKILIKAKDPKQCLTMCIGRFDSCQKTCVNNCAVCSASANRSAVLSDAQYVHEEQVKGGYVVRGLKSYRDPLQCRKVTCNCYADLSTCEQNCTGIIHKQLRTVPYCT